MCQSHQKLNKVVWLHLIEVHGFFFTLDANWTVLSNVRAEVEI